MKENLWFLREIERMRMRFRDGPAPKVNFGIQN